jgi:hypothetical protein
MKASELVAGRTYVGKNGRRRTLLSLRVAGLGDGYYWMGEILAEYGDSYCLARTFARWAVREATPEESAP